MSQVIINRIGLAPDALCHCLPPGLLHVTRLGNWLEFEWDQATQNCSPTDDFILIRKKPTNSCVYISLLCLHDGRNGVSNHRRLDCLLDHLFRHRSKKKHQSSVSLAFVRGIHQWMVNSPHNGPVMQKMFPFDDIILWVARFRPYPKQKY